MLSENDISNAYFEWMYDLVCGKRYSKSISYRKLLSLLHGTEFTYIIPKDENRAEDGIDLRYRFAYDHADIENAELYLSGPCSVLEMMVSLAIRCEETIMCDPDVGDRTGQWFWGMIVSLGLGSMSDSRFDRRFVELTISRFLNHEYEQNGHGGLFTLRHCDRDLRTAEIWQQMCWYLNEVLGI